MKLLNPRDFADLSRRYEPADPVSEQVLDATVELMARHGARIKIDEIAEAARVSRATVFRRFEDKESLIKTAFLREFHCIVALLRAVADEASDPRAAVVGLLEESLRLSQTHPLLVRLCRTEPETVLALVAGSSDDTVAIHGRRLIAGYIRAAQAAGLAAGGADADERADVLVHLLLGYSLLPAGLTDLANHSDRRRLVTSLVESLLGPADASVAT